MYFYPGKFLYIIYIFPHIKRFNFSLVIFYRMEQFSSLIYFFLPFFSVQMYCWVSVKEINLKPLMMESNKQTKQKKKFVSSTKMLYLLLLHTFIKHTHTQHLHKYIHRYKYILLERKWNVKSEEKKKRWKNKNEIKNYVYYGNERDRNFMFFMLCTTIRKSY